MGRVLVLIKTFVFFVLTAVMLLGSVGIASASSIRSPESFYTNSLSEMFIKPYLPVHTIKMPILVYHYVEYVVDPKDPTRKLLATEPHILDEQLETLLSNGYEFVNFKDLENFFDGSALPPKKPIMLTFDDGYEDFYTDAMPIIKKYKVKAVQYVISGVIGKPNYMSKGQLKEVIDTGLVEIGAHTVDHYNLLKLPLNDSLTQIRQSKEALEKEFGISVTTFAYPYGHYNESLQRLVGEAGFDTAVTMDRGYTVKKAEQYSLRRIRPGIAIGEGLINELFSVDN